VRCFRFLLTLLALSLAAACQSTQVAPIDTAHQPLALAPDERKLWDEAQHVQRRIEAIGLVYTNVELEAYIHSVAVRLVADQLQNPGLELKVRVLREPYRNAFVLPNGTFYITTGMLACLDNEAELAFLLGHETTHYTHRHLLKEKRGASNRKVWVDIFGGTSVLVGLGPILGEISSTWATSAFFGYSQELETEADEHGLEEMVQTGYDPQASLTVFKYLGEEEELDSLVTKERDLTHPRMKERVDHCRELLVTRYGAAVVEPGRRINQDEYYAQIQQLLLDNAALDEAAGRPEFARRAVDKYVARWPDCAPGYFSRGEICRRSQDPNVRAQGQAAYREAVRLDPGYAEPHRELGLLYRSEGQLQEARDEFAAYAALSTQAIDTRTILRYVSELDAELAASPAP